MVGKHFPYNSYKHSQDHQHSRQISWTSMNNLPSHPFLFRFWARCHAMDGPGWQFTEWMIQCMKGEYHSVLETNAYMWGSVKIPCWPACLESLGHRSGWGPHRFTWFGYMVLISVLICKGIPLSWSRSDLVSAWHLGGLRCPWPPSSNASPQRWSSTAQKKNWQHTHLQIHRPHFFGRGAQRSFVFLFTFLVSIYIPEST